MEYFVDKGSIVRKIWGQTDTILFIFAGAAAEFALNKAVDWLYFTGRLPADPLGRLFSTVVYSQQIIFSERDAANHAIDKITGIHKAVEENRSAQIPDWAYRDVLFMLIDYSVRSFEVLERKLKPDEKEEIFDVFYRVGMRMGINGLPSNYNEWEIARQAHLQTDMLNSHFTADLYKQYKKHLGTVRYLILKQVQVLVVPDKVSEMLSLGKIPYLVPVLALYKLTRLIKLDKVLIISVLPKAYQAQVRNLTADTF
jgi:hypothetical protein